MGRYETSLGMGQIGVISGHDMTTEAAITKLMYLMGEGLTADKIKRLMEMSIRGEMTE